MQIYTSYDHTFLLTKDNDLYACGFNKNGQLGLYDKEDREEFTKVNYIFDGNIINIACGERHSVILTDKNKIYTCGSNIEGQLGFEENIKESTSFQLIKFDFGKIKKIICGGYHTFVISEDDNFYFTGWNMFKEKNENGWYKYIYQYGFKKFNLPIKNIKNVVSGKNSLYVIKEDKKKNICNLLSCGENKYGELGLGNKNQTLKLQKVENIEKYIKINKNFDFEYNDIIEL
jgi:alpha-tubulin suppressor-like RCC1 family protein